MIPTKHRIFALIVLALGFVMLTTSELKGQKIIRKGDTFIELPDSSNKRSGAKKTKYLYTDAKGVTDTVWISSKGKFFLWKTSKKTGKKYRKYLKIKP